MTTKPFEELMSEINSMNIDEALANAEKCLEAFTVEDIIEKQQKTIESQKAEIDDLSEKLNATIAGQETLQEYIAQRSPLGMVGEG